MPYKRFSLPRDTFLVTQFRQFLPLKGLFQQPQAIAQVCAVYSPMRNPALSVFPPPGRLQREPIGVGARSGPNADPRYMELSRAADEAVGMLAQRATA